MTARIPHPNRGGGAEIRSAQRFRRKLRKVVQWRNASDDQAQVNLKNFPAWQEKNTLSCVCVSCLYCGGYIRTKTVKSEQKSNNTHREQLLHERPGCRLLLSLQQCLWTQRESSPARVHTVRTRAPCFQLNHRHDGLPRLSISSKTEERNI